MNVFDECIKVNVRNMVKHVLAKVTKAWTSSYTTVQITTAKLRFPSAQDDEVKWEMR